MDVLKLFQHDIGNVERIYGYLVGIMSLYYFQFDVEKVYEKLVLFDFKNSVKAGVDRVDFIQV